MFKSRSRRLLIVGLALMVVAGTAGAALAGSVGGLGTTRNGGQGSGSLVGYSVSGVAYTTNTNASPDVTAVSFLLKRTSDGVGASTVTQANTVVYAQLLTTSGAGEWAVCTVGTSPVAGSTTCTLTGSQRRLLSTVTQPSVVAYDR